MIVRLLRDIREEVIGLLFTRYVFRTIRKSFGATRCCGTAAQHLSEWAQIVYAVTNASGVRRLVSASYQDGDVNIVKLLEMLIREPEQLWGCFERHYAADAARVPRRGSGSGDLCFFRFA